MRFEKVDMGQEAKEPDACFGARQELSGFFVFPELIVAPRYGGNFPISEWRLARTN
jgi:hypothetical protein